MVVHGGGADPEILKGKYNVPPDRTRDPGSKNGM